MAILGEVQTKFNRMKNLINSRIIGFPIVQNQQDFVVAKFSIKQIFSFTKYTSRILNSFDEDGEPIYNGEVQREIELSRANKIADFLIENPEATFPTNIVLHIPKQAIEEQIDRANYVEIILREKVFTELEKKNGDVYITIIDGQHRIKGIEIALERIKVDISDLQSVVRSGKSETHSILENRLKDRIQRLKDLEDIELVVSFFIDKTIEYQAMIFSTINRTQKRVSQSLVYDLFGLDTGDTPQKTAIQIIIRLNGHKNSPFYNRIKFYGGSYSAQNSPPLSQATMAKSIVNLISENLREAERDRNRERIELKRKSPGSKKDLPFRKYYANDQDSAISDILFYFFNAVRDIFFDSEIGISLWDIPQGTSKPQNILHTTVGYEALLKILVDILSKETVTEIANENSYKTFLNNIKVLNPKDTLRYTFNNRGKKIFYLDMSLLIWPSNPKDSSDKRLVELKELTEL